MRPQLTCLLTLFGCVYLLGQNARFNNLTPERDGVPQAIMSYMAEDHLGRLWITTYAGLVCYDGYNFTSYSADPSDSTSLPHNNLEMLRFASKDTLLIISNSRLTVFDLSTAIFTDLTESAEFEGPPIPSNVNCVYPEDSQTWWLGTREGLFLVDLRERRTLKFLVEEDPQTLWKQSFNRLLEIEPSEVDEEVLWLTTVSFPVKFNTSSYVFEVYPEDPNFDGEEVSIISRRFPSVFNFDVDNDDNIWMATNGGGVKYVNTSNNSWQDYTIIGGTPDAKGIVVDLEIISDSTIWVATRYNGVQVLDIKGGEFRKFEYDPANPTSILDKGASLVEKDSDGRIWLGMQTGISCWDPHSHIFRAHNSDLGSTSFLGYAEGSENGLYIVRASQAFRFDNESSQLNEIEFVGTDGEPIRHGGLSQFTQLENGDIMYATSAHLMRGVPGIYKLKRGENRAFRIPQMNLLPEENTLSLYYDSAERMWIGSYYSRPTYFQGDSIYQVSEKQMTQVYAISEDHDGGIWFGYEMGLDRLVIDGDKVEVTSPCEERGCQDLVSLVYDIAVDSLGTIWAGTRHSGLIGIDLLASSGFYHISVQDGLPSVEILSVEPQGEYLWIGTGDGLVRMHIETRELNTFTTDDGLLHNVVFNVEYDDAGLLYVSTRAGLNVMDVTRLNEAMNTNPPHVYFKNFLVNGAVPGESATGNIKIGYELKYPFNSFSVEYAGVNLTHPEDHRYKYRLKGIEENWIPAESRRFVSYNNLAPGEYTLEVLSANNHGVWNVEPALLQVSVKPAFWQTRWFIVAVLITVVAILYLGYKYRIRQIRKESELVIAFNKKIVDAESQALRAQMNPHFIFNALNSIKLFVMERDPRQAGVYLDDFARLVRMVLQNSDERLITLDKELEALDLYVKLEKLRFKKEFEFDIDIADDVETDFYEIPPLLLQPYVENAIWHGFMTLDKRGVLKLSVCLVNDKLVIHIIDNGVGRQKAAELRTEENSYKKSMGTKITQDRMDLHRELSNMDIRVDTLNHRDAHGVVAGTRVEITIDYNPHSI